jgi:hypothetical protein
MKNKQPSCPECEKLAAVSEESNKIGEFLEWLDSQQVTLCKWHNGLEMYQPHPFESLSINQLLAQYYDIDLDKVEDERRVLLEWIREMNT